MAMTHRERALAALSHQEPDRVPMDLAGTRNSGITLQAYDHLLDWLGMAGESALLERHGSARLMGVAKVDEEILNRLDVDFRIVHMGAPDGWPGREVDGETYEDEWGVVRRRPPTSLYYDMIHSPLAGEITLDDILRFPWPDPDDEGLYRGLRERAKTLRETTDFAIIMHTSDICIHTSQYMRGFEDWYMDFRAHPDLICALMDAVLEIRLHTARRSLELVGDLVDVVSVGDDVADQRGPQVSPAMFRQYIKPRFARYYDMVHSLTSAKIVHHSCGSVYKLLPDFIDLGIDAIHPVQVTAADMETARLKQEFGDQLVFWGGIDTQHVLPRGSVEEVRQEVRRRIGDLAPGGGYVLGAVHNIQPDVPPENIWAMYEAARQVGRYPISV